MNTYTRLLFFLAIGFMNSMYSMAYSNDSMRTDLCRDDEIRTIEDLENNYTYKQANALLDTLQEKVHAHASLKDIQDISHPYKEIIGSSIVAYVASVPEHSAILEYLLQQGANPNETNTPLFSAIQAGNCEGVRLLLGHGADIMQENDNNPFGNNPLICAVNAHSFNKKNSTIVKLLLEHKDGYKLVNKKSKKSLFVQHDTPPLHILVDLLVTPLPLDQLSTKQCIREGIYLLLEHGANPYLYDENGECAIDTAIKAGLTDFANHMQKKHKEFNDQRLHKILSSYKMKP